MNAVDLWISEKGLELKSEQRFKLNHSSSSRPDEVLFEAGWSPRAGR
jgi:hypothetical protein